MADYKYQFSSSIPLKWVESNLRGLVFPDILKNKDRIMKHFKGVLAISGKQPVGLVLGLADDLNKKFRLVSLKVDPRYRNRKIGTNLIYNLEKGVYQEGYHEMEMQYRSHWESVPAICRISENLKWVGPKFTLRICQSKIEQAFPVFHSKHHLPEGYEFTSWNEVSDKEKERIKTKNIEGIWYPQDVSPFQLEHIIEPTMSVALRYQSKVVGWLIIHKITPETLEYTALFVDEEHRSFKIGHLLMGEGIRRQAMQELYPKFLFTAKASNRAMVRFIERNGPRNGTVLTDVFQFSKCLV